MKLTGRAARCIATMILLGTVCAFNTAMGNHYILPCRDECDSAGWVTIGPDGANIVALVADPGSPLMAFAGTVGAGILRSADGGATWKPSNGGLPTLIVLALAIDPSTPSTLYAGTDFGVFKSIDSGQNWIAANTGLDGQLQTTVNVLAIDPATPATVYAGTSGGIFKTANGAANWALLSKGPRGEPLFITIDATSPSTLYVGVDEANVFKSTDAGTSWTKIRAPYDEADEWPTSLALAIDPDWPSRLYLGTELGLTISLDGGATWSSNLLPGCDIMAALASRTTCWSPMALAGRVIKSLAIDPASSATVYAGTGDGAVFRTTDRGNNWTPVTDGPLAADAGVNVIVATGSSPATIHAGGRTGIFLSSDGAQTWTRPTLGVRNIGVNRLVVDPSTASTIYTTAEGIAKTSDGGDHWSDSSTGISDRHINSLVIDPMSPSILYVGSSPIFKSTDAGAHWAPVPYGLDLFYSVGAMAIAPSRTSTLYIGVDFKGVLKTTDAGASWIPANIGLTAVGIYVSALAVDPTNPDIVYLATPATSGPGTPAKLFKSTDGAAHWRQVPIGLPTNANVTSLVIDPVTPSTIYATYDGYGSIGVGAFKSTDSGETWIAPQNLIPATTMWALAINPSKPLQVYAATSVGVFRSLDGGTSWRSFNAGLPILDVWGLAIDSTGSLLRAATPGGLYEHQLSAPARSPIDAPLGLTRWSR